MILIMIIIHTSHSHPPLLPPPKDIFSGLDNSSTSPREDAPVGSVVYQPPSVIATTYTPRLSYWIISGNAAGKFRIDNTTGLVTLASALDYETTQTYALRIGAQDLNLPCLSGFTSVTINVVDVNDNVPVFTSSMTAAVMESAPNGTLVTTLTATDADSGPRGQVLFSLAPNPSCTTAAQAANNFVILTGRFQYYGPNTTRANCLWFATASQAGAYSCVWHGCYGEAYVLSSTKVKLICVSELNLLMMSMLVLLVISMLVLVMISVLFVVDIDVSFVVGVDVVC